MSVAGIPRRRLATKGAFVVIGVGYAALGPPAFGLEPAFIGSAVAAYGAVSLAGGWLVERSGLLREP